MKTVYLYHPATGAYGGTYEAQESPLEPGVFLIPDASTDSAPPPILDGQRVRFDNGQWLIEDIQVAIPATPVIPTLGELQAAARAKIDIEAGVARARYITVAPGQEATYMIKEAHARAFKAAGYPAAAVAGYPMVEAEAKAMSGDAPSAEQIQAAADGIIAQADAWIAKVAQIEQVRIAGKRAVTAAIDTAGVEAAREAAIAELMLL